MWMLVDIGNSRLHWGRAEGEGLVAGPSFSSVPARLSRQLDDHWGTLDRPEAVFAANVAGDEAGQCLSRWVAEHWSVPVRFARSEASACGVVNGYEQPEMLGVDRWAGLVALRRRYPLPACLADCGTALTLDVLDRDGRHLGGLIAPGLTLMRQSLLRETRGVRGIEGGAIGLLGCNTAEGVAGGVVRACSGLIEKTVGQLAVRLGETPGVVLTGGDAETVGADLGIAHRVAPDLVLWGLLALARNKT